MLKVSEFYLKKTKQRRTTGTLFSLKTEKHHAYNNHSYDFVIELSRGK